MKQQQSLYGEEQPQIEPSPAVDRRSGASPHAGRNAVLVATIGFLLFCETAWQVALAATDAARYQCYALIFWFGSAAIGWLPHKQCALMQLPANQPPFHVLPLEYPPLTLLLFSLPLPVPLQYYTLAYALLMLLAAVGVGWLLVHSGPRHSTRLFVLYLVLGACATLQVRYDLLPAICTLVCVMAGERRRWTLAYSALAVGTLLKLYPIVLLPVLFLAQQQAEGRLSTPPEDARLSALPQAFWKTILGLFRWQWRHCLLFLALVLGVSALFALINFQDAVVQPLTFFAQRPVQIESLDGTLLWIARQLGASWHVDYTFGSINIESNASGGIALVGNCLFVAGLLFALFLQWRQRTDLAQTSIAFLLVLIATGKVFSPQYLLWIIPVLAYAGATRAFWVRFWCIISLLTTFIYVFFYSRLTDAHTAPQLIQTFPGFFESVALRNALFVCFTLAYLCNWLGARQRRAVD